MPILFMLGINILLLIIVFSGHVTADDISMKFAEIIGNHLPATDRLFMIKILNCVLNMI